MRVALLLFSIFLVGSVKAQVELVTTITTNLHGNFNEQIEPFYFTSSRIFTFRSDEDNKLRYIEPSTGRRVVVSESLPSTGLFWGASTEDALYFIRTVSSLNSLSAKLFKVDNNLQITELLDLPIQSFGNNQIHNGFMRKINNKIYFYLRTTDENRFYELNPENDQLLIVHTFDAAANFRLNGIIDDMVFYSYSGSDENHLFLFDGQNNQLITTGQFEVFAGHYQERTALIKSGDAEHVYFRVSNNPTNSFYKIHRTTKNIEFLFESSASFIDVFKYNDDVIWSSHYHPRYWKQEFIEDSLVFTPTLQLKTEFQRSVFYQPDLLFPEIPIYTYYNNELGNEFFSPDADDSLTLYMDLNPGPSHSFPIYDCHSLNSGGSKPRHFSYGNRHYAVLTNGNDSHMYLYEINETGFHSKFRFFDYQQQIRFIPTESHLYYLVRRSNPTESRLYRISWDDMNSPQPDNLDFGAETWSTNISYVVSSAVCAFSYNHISRFQVYQDNNSDILLSFGHQGWSYHPENQIRESKNRFIRETTITQTTAKFNKNGEQIWMNNIGSKYATSSTDKNVLLDKNGNVQVIGSFENVGYFDEDSLTTVGMAYYYARLDGTTGQVASKRIMFLAPANGMYKIEFLADGEDQNFYVSGYYRRFLSDFGDTTLTTLLDRQNFLAKYDYYGNLVWMRNINNSWEDDFGAIKSMNYDSEKNNIFIYCSQDRSAHWCNAPTWDAELLVYDEDGREIKRNHIEGTNANGGGVAMLGNDDMIYLSGRFHGNINAGVYHFQTREEGNCFVSSNFLMGLDLSQNKYVSGFQSSAHTVDFEQVVSDENYNYLFGRNASNKKLTVVRFDKAGQYQGEKELDQNPSDFKITYHNGFFVLAINGSRNDEFLGINLSQYDRSWSGDPNVGVLNLVRFKIDDWSYKRTFSPMDVTHTDGDLSVWAFPNPAYDQVQFNFQDNDKVFEILNIYDATGRLLKSLDIPDQNFMTVSLLDFQAGLYHVVFVGNDEKVTLRLMKQH